MAAVHQRERTGEGKPVEVSQYESTVVILGAALLERSLQAPDLGGSEPPRPGNRDAEAVPHNVYRYRGEDAWCAIAVYNDDQWRALLVARSNNAAALQTKAERNDGVGDRGRGDRAAQTCGHGAWRR